MRQPSTSDPPCLPTARSGDHGLCAAIMSAIQRGADFAGPTNYWPTSGSNKRSLRQGIDGATQWCPIPISSWQRATKSFAYNGLDLLPDKLTKRNLSYSLQYVQYLEQTLTELTLTKILQSQTIKTYIIVTVGIVECLLFHLNKAAGGVQQKLSKIIDRVESLELLGRAPKLYRDLNRYRILRNKVHIYEFRDDPRHDFNSFSRSELNEIRRLLFDLATTPALGLKPDAVELFEFLKRDQASASPRRQAG